ncbi:MAG: hypothetical protein WDZ49_04860 [Litorilinea sp.]
MSQARTGMSGLGVTFAAALLAALLLMPGSIYAQEPDPEPTQDPTTCPHGQGYWRTHSSYGPAPYDATWAEIGEDTEFYTSGQSYHAVLWTPPAGNAYYILAAKVIAAELNLLVTGAEPSAAYTAAVELLATYGPDTPELHAPSDVALRTEFTQLAGYLGMEQENADASEGCPPEASEEDVEQDIEKEVEQDVEENDEENDEENTTDEDIAEENTDTENMAEGETLLSLNSSLDAEQTSNAQLRAVAGPTEPTTLAPGAPLLFMPTLNTD